MFKTKPVRLDAPGRAALVIRIAEHLRTLRLVTLGISAFAMLALLDINAFMAVATIGGLALLTVAVTFGVDVLLALLAQREDHAGTAPDQQ
ncbi:MAG: glycerol uptake facilitator-like aquaporin [Nonlabens sp.]|jgi:glycerol uptake facilitator-like aquaporin